MATYNGEKYIIEQLESIKNQSLPVDEVIICDDGSKDRTAKYIQDYIRDNQLDTWKFFRNATTKGSVKNFLDGAEAATGDILFYSDQDDIWHKDKIERMCQAIKEKHALAVYCLADTIDKEGIIQRDQVAKISRIPRKQYIQEVSLSEKLKYARSSGLCLAFKKEILPDVRKMALQYGLPHDIPVGTVAAVRGTYCVIHEPLVNRRVHAENLSKPDTKLLSSCKSLEKQIKSRRMKLKELQAIDDMYREMLSEKETKALDEAIETTNVIMDCLYHRKIWGIIKAIFTKNEMMNRALAVRNLLAVLYDRSAILKKKRTGRISI
jgi:glycosyltransferase involved in cell wall biosynthesis